MVLLIPKPSTPFIDAKGFVNNEWRRWLENVNEIPNQISIVENAVSNTAPRLYLAADGDAVSFGGTFGVAPSRVVYRAASLPALSAGEVYDIKPINVTATGFDCYAKIKVAGGISDETTGAGSFDAGLGYWTAQKPVTDDAYNQIYSFDFDADLNLVSASGDVRGGFLAEYGGFFDVYVYTSSVWVKITTISVNYQATTIGYPPSIYAYGGYLEPITITQAIGMVAGAEFGVKATSGAVTAFNEVAYQTQAYGATTSAGTRKIEFDVYA